jgi:hypothetical protein
MFNHVVSCVRALEVLENISEDASDGEKKNTSIRFDRKNGNFWVCVHITSYDPRDSFANFDLEKLIELPYFYDADFSDYERTCLMDQLLLFIDEVRNDDGFRDCNDLGHLATKMVKTDRHICFSSVYRLVELALILPVATATVERAFSTMKIIKTGRRK